MSILSPSEPAGILPIASPAVTRTAIRRRLMRRKALLGATAATLLIGSASGLAAPAILGYMVNLVLGGQPVSLLLWASAALLASGALSAVLGYLGQTLLARICEQTLADLREDVFRAAADQPLERIERAGIGDVVARVSGDVEAVSEAVSGVLPAFTAAAFTILITVAGLGLIDWRFAAAALLAAPLQFLTLRWFLGRSGPVYRQVRITEAQRTQQILETVTGADTVTALGLGGTHDQLLDDASRRNIAVEIAGVNLLTGFFNRLNLAEYLGLAAVLGVGFWLVSDGSVTVGAATAAALYFHRLFDPIGLLLGEFDELQKAGAGLSRLFGIIGLSAPGTDSGATTAPGTKAAPAAGPAAARADSAATIVLDAVSFAYPEGREVLHGINLSVAPGEHVAIVGPSGAGKTSLARLVLGLQRPTAGSVRVAGNDPAGPAHGGGAAMVSQEVHVFTGTLAEDLRLAAPGASDAELAAVLRQVGAGWAAGLEHGLGTVVGAGGHRLTADQAQQLALARLILRDPPIVVLDEATAEAGTVSAGILDAAARAAVAGRTAIVIAHRLTQAVSADRIIVMEQGRILESGSHDELLGLGGGYARLWSAWRQGTAV